MKELIIDRKIWLRGSKMIDNTSEDFKMNSMLNRPSDKKMCCIGIYLNQCGLTKKVLLDHPDAAMVIDSRGGEFPKEAMWLVNIENYPNDVYYDNSADAGKLMSENDATANENKITKMFAKHDIKVKFIN